MPLSLIRNDITKVEADVIVNSANPEPIVAGGTDYGIYKAAGKRKLLQARREIGILEPGQLGVTPAFKLQAQYIFHVVADYWRGEETWELLFNCYTRAMEKAVELGCESIAFPLLGAGTYGCPKGEAMEIALTAIRSFLEKEDLDVILVVFDGEAYKLSSELFAVNTAIDDDYADRVEAQEREIDAEEYLDSDVETMICCSAPIEPIRKVMHSSNLVSNTMLGEALALGLGQSGIKKKVKKPLLYGQEKIKYELERLHMEFAAQKEKSFKFKLEELIAKREISNAEAYKKSNVNKQAFNKIFTKEGYTPKKNTVLAFAIGLQLSQEETVDLLSRAGYAFSPDSFRDRIIMYFIKKRIVDIDVVNANLFELGLGYLGGRYGE